MGKKQYIDKYGSLYQNVNHEKSYSLRFTLYFCIRRLIFAFAIIVLRFSIVFQILATDLAVMGMLTFYVSELPMVDGPNNFIQIFNEVVICLVVISMVAFTNFIPNPVHRYNNGYYLLYFVGGSVCVNMAILLVNIVRLISKAYRNWMYKKALTKHIAKTEELQLQLKKKLAEVKSERDKTKR